MLTVEELLVQRYKVIAPYPGSEFEIGDILYRFYFTTTSEAYTYLTSLITPCESKAMKKEYVESMPNIFQPLPWWSDREVEDMPEYVKCDERVWKITEWKKGMLGKIFPINEVDTEGESKNFANIKWHFASARFLPATREEYEAFKQQKEG